MTAPPGDVASGSARNPILQLWRAIRGRESVLPDLPVSLRAVFALRAGGPDAARRTGNVGARLLCFGVALGLTVAIGLGATAILHGRDVPAFSVRHLWGAIGAVLGVALTVAVTRSESRAAVLLLVNGVLAGLIVVAAALLSLATDLRAVPGDYLAVGVGVGSALGGRAGIAHRRPPPVTVRNPSAVWGMIGIMGVVGLVAAAVFGLVQSTKPGECGQLWIAILSAMLAAPAVGVIYHLVDPPASDVLAGAAWKRVLPRVTPIAVAGLSAPWLIPRSAGSWGELLTVGLLAGLFLGYAVDLLERPFAGRRRPTAATTLAVVVIVPTTPLLFDATWFPELLAAQAGALAGLVLGGAPVFAVTPPGRSGPVEPMRQVVLLLAANPLGMDRIKVYEEARMIGVALSQSRDLDYRIVPAAQFLDLQQALRTLNPTVVHLSGHCDGNRFFFHARDDLPDPVPFDLIVEAFRICGESVKVMVVNACKSAGLITAHTNVDFAVGLTEDFKDGAALEFADGFYRAVAGGQKVVEAFQLGRNAARKDHPDPEVMCSSGSGDFPLVPHR